MKFTESTAVDMRIKFLTSVANLDKAIEQQCENIGDDYRLATARTKKMIMKWFFENGGM